VLAFLIACADAAVAPVDPTFEPRTTIEEATWVARGIALALRSPELRVTIRDAMRESALNEHKLVLQDFVATPAGHQLAAAAAAALEVSESSILQTVDRLPSLDFYAPFGKHRREWRATDDVLVATTFDPDTRYLDAFSIDGARVTLDYEDGTPSRPLLILHPAETKARRPSPVAAPRGETIQDADEDETRVIVENQLNSVGFSPDATYINFWNFHPGDGWFGDSELRFEAAFYDGFAQRYTHYGTYRHGNVEEDEGYNVTAEVIAVHPRNPGDILEIHLWEDDVGPECDTHPLCDDYYGWVEYRSSERRQMKQYVPEYAPNTEIIVDWFMGYNRIPAEVTIWPSPATVGAGGTTQLFYNVRDQTGQFLAPDDHAPPTWESLNPSVATVSSTGLVTGGSSEASATIRITVCTAPGFQREGSPCAQKTVTVHVQVPIANISISPNPVNVPEGQWAYVSATAYDANNQPIPGISFTWQTDNPAIATTTGSSVSGIAQGTTTLRASARGRTGTAVVNVTAAPQFQVSIQGHGEVPPYTTCRWWTGNYNGVEPYTYRWWVMGSLVSQDPVLSWTSSSSGFDISVEVTDGQGRVATSATYVNVSSSSGGCIDQ
jgi:hypothetical protein